MKLLVIVLCLLSERFLIHRISHSRFHWFSSYFTGISQRLPKTEISLFSEIFILSAVVLPLLLLTWLVLAILGHWLFGFVGLLLHLVIFYYCLGPENPFYPVREGEEGEDEVITGNYFAKVNGGLFAVIFWYIAAGPLGVLVYRLISLSRTQSLTTRLAQMLTDLLDWVPARLTVLLYLLVGNFQKGIRFWIGMFFASPDKNYLLLSQGGLLAAKTDEMEVIQMPYAENLVEYALIVYLVFLALFTLVAWL
ncbi:MULTISPECIES: regulatory signaling modulator protein AmpE [unclassified Legionella]|uniref:regulatory signaling modulator protein AmpE n=1 Tax=unclassified Legionella TaxID=2622702 RepID=UPI0010559D06|nr:MULTISPECIES: regulatory signaling modulator protein AmpE [unclassified Legionella]MDI9818248.1 regulatory signaling modulator protein AmpE [Legionella sp. PL877]